MSEAANQAAKRESMRQGVTWPPPGNAVCRALGNCLAPIPDTHLFCKRHWLMARKRTRRRLWREMKTGYVLPDGLLRLVIQIADEELCQMREAFEHSRQVEREARQLARAAREGPHAHAAYLAAKMAVEAMLERQAGK